MPPTPHTARDPHARALHLLTAFAVVLATVALLLSRLKGDFVRPPFFWTFRFLFYFQQALFLSLGYLALAAGGALVRRRALPAWLTFWPYYAVFIGIAWYVVWAFVRGSFGHELTLSIVLSVFTERGGLRQSGMSPYVLVPLVALAFGVVAVWARLAQRAARAAEPAVVLRTAGRVALLFVAIHLPVRAWFVHHLNHRQYAVMALDDYVRFAPRIERLVPGLLVPRPTLPNVEAPARTQAYIDALARLPLPAAPRTPDIVSISIESLRFDALDATTTPALWRRRDAFQLRLGEHHWSGGNATQFGIFSQLMGVGSYHLERFMDAGVTFPLWRLLQQSGYHVRVGKERYFTFRHLYQFAPPGTEFFAADADALDETDRLMLDGWLAQRSARPAGRPQLDFLPFDATHWPYEFPAEHAVFQPVGDPSGGVHIVRTPAALAAVRNRYRNATHFVDAQLERLFARLDADDAWSRTVVIVTGDHGEEFQERGQITHTSVLNDFQARVPLWIHLPGDPAPLPEPPGPTAHIDLVPTLLDALGYTEDILYTQGRSLLDRSAPPRRTLMLAEQGNYFPLYHSIVGETYITRWWHDPEAFTFSGVERRDGAAVVGDAWRAEAEHDYGVAAGMYLVLPDPALPPRPLRGAARPAP